MVQPVRLSDTHGTSCLAMAFKGERLQQMEALSKPVVTENDVAAVVSAWTKVKQSEEGGVYVWWGRSYLDLPGFSRLLAAFWRLFNYIKPTKVDSNQRVLILGRTWALRVVRVFYRCVVYSGQNGTRASCLEKFSDSEGGPKQKATQQKTKRQTYQ